MLSLDEARLTTILWAVESMTSLYFSKIISTGDFKEMFCAVEKPHQWPAFRHQGEGIKLKLNFMKEYQLRVVKHEENRGASFIVQHVIRKGLVQSYVANGHPSWFFVCFSTQRRLGDTHVPPLC